jgi:hypothetical protein
MSLDQEKLQSQLASLEASRRMDGLYSLEEALSQGQLELSPEAFRTIVRIASTDENAHVRAQAQRLLSSDQYPGHPAVHDPQSKKPPTASPRPQEVQMSEDTELDQFKRTMESEDTTYLEALLRQGQSSDWGNRLTTEQQDVIAEILLARVEARPDGQATDVSKLLARLRSADRTSRYDACEELRVASSLSATALLALQEATHDPDPLVADAATRAFRTHRPHRPSAPAPLVLQSTAPSSSPSLARDVPPPSPPAIPQSQPMPSSSPNSPEYVFALEKRIMFLESQLPSLARALADASNRPRPEGPRLPNTALVSPHFITRAFTVWGHFLVAQLIIALPLYLIIFLIGVSSY